MNETTPEIENTHDKCSHGFRAPCLFLVCVEKLHPEGSPAPIHRYNYRAFRAPHRHTRHKTLPPLRVGSSGVRSLHAR